MLLILFSFHLLELFQLYLNKYYLFYILIQLAYFFLHGWELFQLFCGSINLFLQFLILVTQLCFILCLFLENFFSHVLTSTKLFYLFSLLLWEYVQFLIFLQEKIFYCNFMFHLGWIGNGCCAFGLLNSLQLSDLFLVLLYLILVSGCYLLYLFLILLFDLSDILLGVGGNYLQVLLDDLVRVKSIKGN